jgi:RNA polymerase sigma factor (sigma-70 family)
MRTRQDLIEEFSTFVQFEGDRFSAWVAEPRLRRSMERTVADGNKSDGNKSDGNRKDSKREGESFWALYWHKVWRGGEGLRVTLAREHLVAYVQEPCYWTALRTAEGFGAGQADCFQMAIAQIDKVLKGFDAQQGFNFKAYAGATLGSLMREGLRLQQEVNICTDWALLRKLSQKRLGEALLNAGLGTDVIAAYTLVWQGFKLLYAPKQETGTRKLPKPDAGTLGAIADYYNGQRQAPAERMTGEAVEKALLASAKAGRAYLYPSLVSMNAPKPGQDAGEWLDDLAETAAGGETDSLLTEMIAGEEEEERRNQWIAIDRVLREAMASLDEEGRSLLRFYYVEHLTQQEMATRLSIQQYTVSRRLTRARDNLLKALATWSQDALHISPTSDVLKGMGGALEEWLGGL